MRKYPGASKARPNATTKPFDCKTWSQKSASVSSLSLAVFWPLKPWQDGNKEKAPSGNLANTPSMHSHQSNGQKEPQNRWKYGQNYTNNSLNAITAANDVSFRTTIQDFQAPARQNGSRIYPRPIVAQRLNDAPMASLPKALIVNIDPLAPRALR